MKQDTTRPKYFFLVVFKSEFYLCRRTKFLVTTFQMSVVFQVGLTKDFEESSLRF